RPPVPRSWPPGGRLDAELAVDAPVVFGRAQDLPDVVLRFRVRDVVDELVGGDTGAFGHPPRHGAGSGVVAGERVRHAAEAIDEVSEVGGANLHVGRRIGEPRQRVARNPQATRV